MTLYLLRLVMQSSHLPWVAPLLTAHLLIQLWWVSRSVCLPHMLLTINLSMKWIICYLPPLKIVHLHHFRPAMIRYSPFPQIQQEIHRNIWISALDLYIEDKAILESTSWLNDGIIYAAQSLLRDETKGQVNGWQSTQCSRNGGSFKIVPTKQPFIQILHVANCHWTVCSNIDTNSVMIV